MGKHRSDKRSRNVVSSDEEDGPSSSKNQKTDHAREDEFGNLFDEEERERLNQMSEKDREIAIYKRMEMNQMLKTREEIKKKLEMTQKAEEKKTKDKKSSGAGTSSELRTLRNGGGGKKEKVHSGSDSSESSNDERDDEDEKDEEDFSMSSASSDEGEEQSSEEEDDDEEITIAKKDAKKKKPAASGKKSKAVDDSGSSEDDDFDTEYHRPSELAHKHSKKRAMDTLLSKRRDKKEAEEKRKQKAKATLDIDEIFGDDDAKSASSSSSSDSSSSVSSQGASPEPKPEIEDIKQLSKARISRFKLAQFVHAPFFSKLALGCFVRIGIGNGPDGRSLYRVAQIIDIVESGKVYQVEKTRTNKSLKLKHGLDERLYRIEFVSNSDFTSAEFQHWKTSMQRKNVPLPTIDFVERKEKEIKQYANYQFTNADIDYMVKEKTKFQKGPSNFAFQKGELMKAKEYAEQCGDFQKVQELQQKIDELEARASELDRQRSQKLSVVTWINQRNRDHMKQAFLSSNKLSGVDVSVADDPFTRKSGKMRVVSGKNKKGDASPQNGTASPSVRGANSSATQGGSAVGAPGTIAASSSSLGGGLRVHLQSVNDLFSAHDIDIDIQLKLPTGPPARLPTSVDQPSSAAPRPAGSRSLTLEEYKRKRGLI